MELQGTKALVTGGSEGIGKGIAAALRQDGADVVITGRRADILEATAAWGPSAASPWCWRWWASTACLPNR